MPGGVAICVARFLVALIELSPRNVPKPQVQSVPSDFNANAVLPATRATITSVKKGFPASLVVTLYHVVAFPVLLFPLKLPNLERTQTSPLQVTIIRVPLLPVFKVAVIIFTSAGVTPVGRPFVLAPTVIFWNVELVVSAPAKTRSCEPQAYKPSSAKAIN